MTQQKNEPSVNWQVIHQSQIEQAARSERIEKNQDRADEKIDKLVSAMSELTSTLTGYSRELRHTSKDLEETNEHVKSLTSRVTVLEIQGASRETRLKIIIGAMAAAMSFASAWVLAVFTGK